MGLLSHPAKLYITEVPSDEFTLRFAVRRSRGLFKKDWWGEGCWHPSIANTYSTRELAEKQIDNIKEQNLQEVDNED